MSRFVVVGAGIIGASITYYLASRGAPVTLIDQASSPAKGVTGNSFGWFSGGTGGDWPGGAKDLCSSVLTDYRRLDAEVPELSVRWSGSLVGTDTSVRISNGTQLIEGQQWIEKDEIALLEPNLQKVPERAIYTPTDGGIDPVDATQALISAARTYGAEIVFDSGVATLKQVDGHVDGVLAEDKFYPAETVILAAAAAQLRYANHWVSFYP